MGTITDKFGEVFRPFNTDGVPASGPYKPEKSLAQALGVAIEAAIGSSALGSVSVTKTTLALLNADLAHPDGASALVYADSTGTNNDLYTKSGASGSGSWTNTGILHSVSSAAAASASAAASSATSAAAARDAVRPLFGTVAPTTEGVDGQSYYQISGGIVTFYGPKASGVWPAGLQLTGANGTNGTNGTNGANGADGAQVRNLTGQGIPANNLGANGDFYTDSATNLKYGPKASGTWPLGTVTDVNAPWTRYEFRYGATFPSSSLSLTRASASTNLAYQDPPGFAYSTFAANAAVLHPIRGLGLFPSSTNYFLNSTAPVNQTITLAAGTYYVWGNGTDTITSAAGTAVGTGFGALNLSAQTYQTLVITTGGTVTFTRANTGTWLAFQVETSSGSTLAMPTPLIVTGGTATLRLADVMSVTGPMLSCLQALTGTFLVQTYSIGTPFNTFRSPAILTLVTGAAQYVALGTGSDPTYLSNNNSTGSNTIFLGNGNFNARTRVAIAWSGTTSSIGGGDYLPTDLSSTLLNGTARDGARLGCSTTSTTGGNTLGGWIERIETLGSRLSDTDLYSSYSSWAPPASSTLFTNRGPKDLPMFRKAKALMDAGQRDAVLCIMGSSHAAGAYPSSNLKQNNWPWLLTTMLTARGIPSWPYAYTGNSVIVVGTGANTYDPNVTFSSGWSNSVGNQFGGHVLQTTTSGATMTHAIPVNTNSFTVKSYTGPGYGSFTIAANGGAVLATVNCNGTAGTQLTTVTVPLGVNSFVITTTSASKVAIAWTLPNDTTYYKALLFNGAMGGANADTISIDVGPENSYLSGLRELAPDLTIMQGPVTNSITSATTATAFLTDLRAIYAAATITGSVFMMNDPASDPASGRPTASQLFYSNLIKSLAWEKGVPFVDVYGLGSYAALQLRGYYGDSVHENAAGNALVATLAADMITLP